MSTVEPPQTSQIAPTSEAPTDFGDPNGQTDFGNGGMPVDVQDMLALREIVGEIIGGLMSVVASEKEGENDTIDTSNETETQAGPVLDVQNLCESGQAIFMIKIFLVVPVFIMIASMLNSRKRIRCTSSSDRCFLPFFHDRPSIIQIFDLLQDDINRINYTMVFISVTYKLINMITSGGRDYFGHIDPIYGSFAIMALVLGVGFESYPFVAAFYLQHTVTYVYAIVYMFFNTFAAFYLIFRCDEWSGSIEWKLVEASPALLAYIYLSFSLPYRLLQHLGVFDKFVSGTAESDTLSIKTRFLQHATEYIDEFQWNHVRYLLTNHKRTHRYHKYGEEFNQAIENGWIYRNMPGFRFSLSILIAVSCGITLVFMSLIKLARQFTLFREMVIQLLEAFSTEIEQLRYMALGTLDSASESAINSGNEVTFLTDTISGTLYFSLFLGFLLTTASLLSILSNYRSHLLRMQRGDAASFPNFRNWSPRQFVLQSCKFVGYQFGYAFWGMMVLTMFITLTFFTVVILSILIFRYEIYSILYWLLRKTLPIVIFLTLVLVVQNLAVHFFFMLKNDARRKTVAINNRRAFRNFQYFTIFASASVGLFSCLLRIIKATILGVLTVPRQDMSCFNRTYEANDAGFVSYVALVRLEHEFRNPVLNVFLQLAKRREVPSVADDPNWWEKQEQEKQAKRDRSSRKKKKNRNSISSTNSSVAPTAAASEDEISKQNDVGSNGYPNHSYHHSDSSNGNDSNVASELITRAKLRAKIRWCVLVTLINNPGLIIYRKEFYYHKQKNQSQAVMTQLLALSHTMKNFTSIKKSSPIDNEPLNDETINM